VSSARRCLVVTLEDDLFAVPAVAGELFADAGDHVVEAADVGVDVEIEFGGQERGIGRRHRQGLAEPGGALFDDAGEVILDVAAEAGPALLGAAQSGEVMEVGMARRKCLELFVVVEIRFVACAVDEPDIFSVGEVGTVDGKEVLEEAAHGSDAGSGSDEDGVGDGRVEDEVAVGAVDLDRAADGEIGQVGEVIGEEPAFDAVDAKVKPVAVFGRSDGVGAGLLLADGVIGHG